MIDGVELSTPGDANGEPASAVAYVRPHDIEISRNHDAVDGYQAPTRLTSLREKLELFAAQRMRHAAADQCCVARREPRTAAL